MTAQAKPQAWMQWCWDLGKTTAFGAVRTIVFAFWLLLTLFGGLPVLKLIHDFWTPVIGWAIVIERAASNPAPASVLPQAKAKGAK